MLGKTVGKYRVIERLGRGGMGTVYKAVDETLDREVAIKVLNADVGDSDVLKRFRGEAVTLARLSHPGIATIYELYRQDDDLLMVMEFLRGETVHDLCDRVGPLAPPQAAHIAIQVLDALAHAHRAGVVHRDLKPANLMITESGNVKVMDFGIARVLGTEHFTQGGYMMGTPAYMAPEQVLGRPIDGRADLYSVGVVLYRLLCGQLPFNADTAIAMVQKQVSEAPTPITQFRPDLPSWCAEILNRALAKSPADRFQTAEEFRTALLSTVQPQALGEMATVAAPTPPGLLLPNDLTLGRASTTGVSSPSGRMQPRTAASAVALATPPTAPSPIRPSADSVQPTPVTAVRPNIERTTTTVVLGRTHLAALGGIIIVLLVGVAVLAFLALRRSGLPQQLPFGAVPPATSAAAPPPQPSGTTPAPPETAGPTTPVPTPPPNQSAPVKGPQPPPGAVKPPTPGTPSDGGVAATAGSVPAPLRPDGRVATIPTDTSSSTVPPAGARGRSVPSSTPAPTSPPAIAQPVTFKDVRLLVENGGRTRELTGILSVGDGQVTVLDKNGGAPLMSVAYGALTGAFFSRSKQPKWRDASGKEVVGKVDLGPFGVFKSDRNWLILLSNAGPFVIRLDDSNLKSILPAVEQRTGVRIQR